MNREQFSQFWANFGFLGRTFAVVSDFEKCKNAL